MLKKKKFYITCLCLILLIISLELIINQRKDKYIHISLDDTIQVFEDLTIDIDAKSIFDNETLAFLKDCHDKYGMVFSLYVFYEKENFNLSNTTDRFKKEFQENSDWLKFGFHAKKEYMNYENSSYENAYNDYTQVINELVRITGGKSVIDRFPRLANFAGNQESIQAMKAAKYGVQGLLGSDDERTSYYLNEEESSILVKNGSYLDSKHNLEFLTSLKRIEENDHLIKDCDSRKICIVFTHEALLKNDDVKRKLNELGEWVKESKGKYIFPMDLELARYFK